MLKIKRFELNFEFKPQDLCVGAFWKSTPSEFDIWVCFAPTLALHIRYIKILKTPIDEILRNYAITIGVDVSEFNTKVKPLFPTLREKAEPQDK